MWDDCTEKKTSFHDINTINFRIIPVTVTVFFKMYVCDKWGLLAIFHGCIIVEAFADRVEMISTDFLRVLQSLNDNLIPILNFESVYALRLWRNDKRFTGGELYRSHEYLLIGGSKHILHSTCSLRWGWRREEMIAVYDRLLMVMSQEFSVVQLLVLANKTSTS